jgi:hypothetical protein
MGDTSTPFIAFPYDGGHIPPSSPLLGGVPQHFVGINIKLFGAGSQALPPYNMPIGLTPFSFFIAFGNNSFSSAVVSDWGKPYLWTTTSYTGYYSFTWGTLRNSFLTRTLESMAGTIPLSKDVNRGQPLPYLVEPQEMPNAYACRTSRGKPLPKSLECDARSTLYVLLWEPTDDVSTSAQSIHQSRPWLLSEPWPST